MRNGWPRYSHRLWLRLQKKIEPSLVPGTGTVGWPHSTSPPMGGTIGSPVTSMPGVEQCEASGSASTLAAAVASRPVSVAASGCAGAPDRQATTSSARRAPSSKPP
jgi:hypothetical protein